MPLPADVVGELARYLVSRRLYADPEDIGNQGASLLGKASDAAERAPGLSTGQAIDPRQGIAAHLFFSVLVLQRYGASLEQIEVVLNLLLVFYEAMKCSGASWPVISEDVQERCLARISGRVRFIEGLTPQL